MEEDVYASLLLCPPPPSSSFDMTHFTGSQFGYSGHGGKIYFWRHHRLLAESGQVGRTGIGQSRGRAIRGRMVQKRIPLHHY